MASTEVTTLIAQLRTVLELTHTEIQVAETRIAQARTDAVKKELTENARHGRERTLTIESAIRELGGLPEVVGPFIGRAAAAFKAFAEQAQPFDEAILGDLVLEHELLDRARYIKALAVAAQRKDIEDLAAKLITAHSATVEWLTTVLAEDALGGPAALRRTPLQAAAGLAVKAANLPLIWSARGLDRVVDALRNTQPTIDGLANRGAEVRDVATKAFAASRDAALETAEKVTRDAGAEDAADVLHSLRSASGVVTAEELPISDYDSLNVTEAVTAVKGLDEAADLRVVIAYEEQHKNRHGVVSAAQVRVADIAREVVGV
jgi:hypothetical protein